MKKPRWLVLIHHIPPKPDYFRVKVRRRLQRVGAVPLKNSVYVLPHTDDAVEDFQWLRRMVVDEGGEATLCEASFVDGVTDEEVESMFRSQSDSEYDEIIENVRAIGENPTEADLRRLKRQLSLARRRDFFGGERAPSAGHAVKKVEEAMAGRGEQKLEAARDGGTSIPKGSTWVTRAGVFIDRIASAWLIRRFIDPDGRFKFVEPQGYEPEPGELRFDMFEGEYTHEGDDCTFEVLLSRFALEDASLRAIAEIVHDIDCKDEKFGRDEASGIATVIRGVASAHDNDEARMQAGFEVFDGLYATFRSASS